MRLYLKITEDGLKQEKENPWRKWEQRRSRSYKQIEPSKNKVLQLQC